MLFPEGMIASCLAPSQVLSLRVISAKLTSEVGPESRSGITGRDPQAHFLPVVLNLGRGFLGFRTLGETPRDISFLQCWGSLSGVWNPLTLFEKSCVHVWGRGVFFLMHSLPTILSSGETS